MIFDTGNSGEPPKKVAEFKQELTDILNTLSSVKGRDYANVVKNIFCFKNAHTGMLYIIARVAQEGGIDLDKSFQMKVLHEMLHSMEEDLTHDLAHLLIPVLMGRMLHEKGQLTVPDCSDIVRDLMQDVAVLGRKQDEYNLGAKGQNK